jgi:exosome complex component RRP40
MKILFPGENVLNGVDRKIGPGLSQINDDIIATKNGVLVEGNGYIYLNYNQKRYLPQLGEPVVGKIVGKTSENYKVDIGSPFLAILNACAFEGASKRNKPNLSIGSLVYARVSLADKDMEPEIECMGATGKSEGYGEIQEGHLIEVSLALSRRYT